MTTKTSNNCSMRSWTTSSRLAPLLSGPCCLGGGPTFTTWPKSAIPAQGESLPSVVVLKRPATRHEEAGWGHAGRARCPGGRVVFSCFGKASDSACWPIASADKDQQAATDAAKAQ